MTAAAPPTCWTASDRARSCSLTAPTTATRSAQAMIAHGRLGQRQADAEPQ